MFKVDIFLPNRPFDRQQLNRRQPFLLTPESDQSLYITSPEDTILAKLAWYKMGGEVSEWQWRYIPGILTLQQNRLNMDCLRQTAVQLGVSPLLARALAQTH